jgi:hypothetical protein
VSSKLPDFNLPGEDEMLLFMRGATNAGFEVGLDCPSSEPAPDEVPGQDGLGEIVDEYALRASPR